MSSFTIDVIEVSDFKFKKLGSTAYYAGLTLKGLGLDPVIVSSLGYDGRRLGFLSNSFEKIF
ncbi:MAG: hypothetical protein P3X22_002740 [Thermoprotei archaeon]|nr:hypothetical protein [Thermoprotei archaeon]